MCIQYTAPPLAADVSPICLALSVSGTYLTPMSFVLVIAPLPLVNLSTCSRNWSRPSGPTGMIMRPPGPS